MTVLFVYSTGRCGTQFLQTFFRQNLGERAVVEHEPIGADYAPKLALRHPDLAALRPAVPAVDRHLDRIAQIVSAGKIYVETGWPAFAWLPLFKRLFDAEFRYVHVVRNPLYFACSMFTHDFYDWRSATTATCDWPPSSPAIPASCTKSWAPIGQR